MNKQKPNKDIKKEQKAHYFIAIPIPEKIRQQIKSNLGEIKKYSPFKKWVEPIDYHLTLAFLGDVPKEKLHTICVLLEQKMKDLDPFPLEIDKFGVFGAIEKPRIFWLGVKEQKQLLSLQQIVYNLCIKAGVVLEKRAFHPHITLARKWDGNSSFLNPSIHQWFPSQEPLLFTVDTIHLFQTHLDNIPKYVPIYCFSISEDTC